MIRCSKKNKEILRENACERNKKNLIKILGPGKFATQAPL